MVGVMRLAAVMALCGFVLGGVMGWAMTAAWEDDRSGAGARAAALERHAAALYEAGERGVEYERTIRAARQAEALAASSREGPGMAVAVWPMAVCAWIGAMLLGCGAFVLGGLGLWVRRGFQSEAQS